MQNIKKKSNFANEIWAERLPFPMTLHIFNPEHDLALAANALRFTAPHAVRQLRQSLEFIPAFWAERGDAVLVEDCMLARKNAEMVAARLNMMGIGAAVRGVFLNRDNLRNLKIDRVEAWGWDRALYCELQRYGVGGQSLPHINALARTRCLSNRNTGAELLRCLQTDDTTGEVVACETEKDITNALNGRPNSVVKAPWSSSGRGVVFVKRGNITQSQAGWIRHTLKSQGCVMVEPYYNKVKDFAMEFFCNGNGQVDYLGLSLFDTRNGAYAGNLLATEKTKIGMLTRWIPESLLAATSCKICQEASLLFGGGYKGYFGVDMMVVPKAGGNGFMLHPCVEINLRRTMGHLALNFSPKDDDIVKVMRICYDSNKYKLKITNT